MERGWFAVGGGTALHRSHLRFSKVDGTLKEDLAKLKDIEGRGRVTAKDKKERWVYPK